MKKYILMTGMLLCFGAYYAQEQQPTTHETPAEVRAILTLNEQLIKIDAARAAMAGSSREGAAIAQKDLQVLLEQYRQMLEKEINRPATGKTLEALKAELANVSTQLTSSVQR